jgi:serine/threonine-protein kinase
VRQFLEGVDLETHVRQGGPLPLHEAALYILQAAEAVAETHSHGIIVRELEPRTLFLTQRAGGECVKIIDFGTAKLMRDAAAPTAGGDLTATAMFGLSPYSSPELVRKAKNVDARTDVWSLGACFYHLLAARPPFGGDTGTLMLAITREEPAPITHLRPDLPPELDDILGWALAKDIDARFRNVHALAHALAPYTGPEGQVLAERIGRMTEAARARRSGAPPAPPSYAPSSRPAPRAHASHAHHGGSGELDFDESVTVLNRQYGPPPSFGAMPAPPSSRPGSVPPPPPSVPPPPSADPYLAAPPASMPGPALVVQPVPSVVPATLTRSMAGIGPLDRRMALGALASAAVLLPLVIAIVFLRSGREPAEPRGMDALPSRPAAAAQEAPAGVRPGTETNAGSSPAATQQIVIQPQPTPATPAMPIEPAPAVAVPASPVAQPKSVGAPVKGALPVKAPTPSAPESPAPSGGTGTLVAVSTGGSCTFAVNGAAKGTGTSTKVQLAPGAYSVSCKPSGGSAKSRSVTVKAGETAMVSFKL